MTYRGAVLPCATPIDEGSALVFVERFQQEPITEIKFYGRPDCSPEQIKEWEEAGYIPIDIGPEVGNMKSASEIVATERFGCNENDRTPGENRVLDLLARNNATGYLGRFHMNMSELVRASYELSGREHIEVINRLKDVICAFIETEDKKADNAPHGRSDSDLQQELPNLFEATRKCQCGPLTLGRYLRDLWRLERPVEEIREKVSFWLETWERLREETAKARREWPQVEKTEFIVSEGLTGVAIETASRLVSKVGATTVGVLINRNPVTGQTVVKTKRLNLELLNRELNRLEPGRWYYHKNSGHLINGGPMHPEVEPTGLSIRQLVDLIKQFPPK